MISDSILAAYVKMFPWKFRYRWGSPLIGLLMGMRDNCVDFKDYRVYLNPRDKTATELFLVHFNSGAWVWESYEISLFVSSVRANPGCLVLDIGANYGAYTLSTAAAAHQAGVRKIVSMEPNPATFACLERSVRHNAYEPYVQLVHGAVTDRHNVECALFAHETFSAMSRSSTVAQCEVPEGHQASGTVRGVSIDGLLPELGLDESCPLVVKIDIEGGEPLAFRGMESTLAAAPGYHVYFELHPPALKSSGHDPADLGRIVFDLGPDLVAEVDQHEKKVRPIRSLADFEAIVNRCLTTGEMWQDYTNIFVGKGLALPPELRGLAG
jgi:FkbM family methyltransferase